MRIADRLSKEQKQRLNKMVQPKKKPVSKSKPKKQENLSIKDWEDIMGKNRDIYTRKNGAVRRK